MKVVVVVAVFSFCKETSYDLQGEVGRTLGPLSQTRKPNLYWWHVGGELGIALGGQIGWR